MPRFVVVLDTPGIKEYVYGTDALAEVRGTSALLDRLNRFDTKPLLREALAARASQFKFDPVFANGGTGQFVVTAERDDVEAALRELAREYRKETGGEVRIIWGLAEYDSDADYSAAVERAHTQMRLKRETDFGFAATTLMPLLQECESASHLPTKVGTYRWGGETLRISEAVRRKRLEAREEKRDRRDVAGAWVDWMKRLHLRDWSVPLRPRDGVQVAEIRERRRGPRPPRKGYVGLVYADGNAMGRLVQELDSVKTCEDFSDIVDGSIRVACFEALEAACGPEIEAARWAAGKGETPRPLPADILFVGGDDLLVLLPADAALDFAVRATAAFGRLTRERVAELRADSLPRRFFDRTLQGRGMTVSCGIALAPAHYPFYLLRHLAEELLKNAKKGGSDEVQKLIRERKLRPEEGKYWAPAYLDFHLIAGAATADLDVVREDDYHVKTDHPRTLRPYPCGGLERLLKEAVRLRQARLPRSKLQDLYDAALEPRPAVARRRARELFGRLRDDRERQALRLALDAEDVGPLADFPWRKDGRTALADLVEAYDLSPRGGLGMSSEPQRLDLAYRVEWEGDWHVGSGLGTATIDRLVRRRRGPKGPPFVPGSQLKGVLRHQCERLAASLDCPVVPPHELARPPAALLENFGPLTRSGLLIDRLFGSRYEGGCLFVDDAEAEDPRQWDIRAHGRTAIDRVSGTAREATLFVSEVVGRGRTGSDRATGLRGRIRARHPVGVLTQLGAEFPYEYALLIAGLLSLDGLGGGKSTGLGRCRIRVEEQGLRWNGRAVGLDEALRSFAEDDWQGWITEIRKEQGA